jgi:S-adenosylmethionine:diacylglycerol 3-amino-3-carboxypropyl transferase
MAALAPGRDDTVLCIAAGGGRALSLLAAGPGHLMALDQRESQLHALELKAAALDAFSHPRLRAFLGLDAGPHRLDDYAALRAGLSPRARRYWDARPELVRRGALYAGRLETALARHAGWLRRAGLMTWPHAAFASRTLAEQREVLARAAGEIARGRAFWRALFSPIAVALLLQDPSFRRSTHGGVGSYLYGRMLAFAQRRPVRESALLHLIWHGRYDGDGALPHWLTLEGAERARKHLSRLVLRHASIEELARRPPRGARLCWSLSDVSAWMSEPRFHALLAAIAGASPSGSRLCWRHLAAQWRTPAHPRLAPDTARARALERADSSVFYGIGVARVE